MLYHIAWLQSCLGLPRSGALCLACTVAITHTTLTVWRCLGVFLRYQDSDGQPSVLKRPLSMSSMLDCNNPAQVAHHVVISSPSSTGHSAHCRSQNNHC